MWIKSSNGRLVNLNTGTVIRVTEYHSVVLELPFRDFNDFYLSFDEDPNQPNDAYFEDCGQVNYENKILEEFRTRKEAEEYVDKLAKKLGVVEV